MVENELATLLSGAVGAILGGIITAVGLLTSVRWKIAEENVLKQRAKWRDEVRHLVERSVEETDVKKLRVIATGLALRLNPRDSATKDDRHLVALVFSLVDYDNRNDRTYGRIVALAAHILKHDWTRAKWEARLRLFRGSEPKQTPLVGRTTYVLPTWVGLGDPGRWENS